MDLAHPERLSTWVVLSAGLLLAALLLRRRSRGGPLQALSLLLRAGLVGALLLVLLEPQELDATRSRGTLLVAVDLSRSVRPGERTEAWRALLRRAAPSASDVLAVGFGARDRLLARGPVPEVSEDLPDGEDLESRAGSALAKLLLTPEAAPGAGRLVLLTDGVLGPPLRGVAPARGLRPLVLPVGGRLAADVRARELSLAQEPAVGDPLALHLVVSASRAVAAEVTLSLGDEVVRRVPVKLEAGEQGLDLTLPALPAGRHLVVARVRPAGAGSEDEILDDAVALAVLVRAAPWVRLVSDTDRGWVQAALEAQGIEVRRRTADAFCGAPGADAGPASVVNEAAASEPSVLVLDRVAVTRLSAPAVLEHVRRHLQGGGGLLFLPREERGELYGEMERPFLQLLPLQGQKPPPEVKEEDRPENPDDPEGLAPPDPTKKKKEKRKAPSLGLVLVIDVSDSMKEGGRIRLAKEAAIAAAEILHQKDLVGVVAFNHEASIVLELTEARDKPAITRRIARLRAGGGTMFYNALALVQEMFAGEKLAIKHAILLSDGDSRFDKPLKPLITAMAADGITLSTIGCGRSFNATRLTDMALWGHGKFHPAFSADEIPQVFTIEVERVIKATGARRRNAEDPQQRTEPAQPDEPAVPPAKKEPEEPRPRPVRLGLPATYTRGVGPERMQGLLGLHATQPRRGAWVSLELDAGEPVLAHGFFGDGRVLSWTLPIEGAWGTYLRGWEGLQALIVQSVRFLMRDGSRERYHVLAASQGRSVLVQVLDRRDRVLPGRGSLLQVRSATGRRPACRVSRLDRDLWRLALDPTDPACALDITFAVDGQPGSGAAFVNVPPPPEVRGRGLDLEGLEAWAAALGGRVATRVADVGDIPQRVTVVRRPAHLSWLPWLAVLFLLDLLLKRVVPGVPRERRT